MTIDDKIRGEKLRCDINREAAKTSALSCIKNGKFEYLTSEEIFSSNQRQIVEQAKFTYFPLGKTFDKQTKMIEDQGRKQIDSIKNLNERLPTLTNKDDHNDNYKEIDKLVTEIFDEIKEITYETNKNHLTYLFKGYIA